MERAHLCRMLGCVLGAQFVEDRLNGKNYKVCQGSGQGLCISSDLADYVFDHAVESKILDNPALLESCDLRLYGRYVDNIYVVGNKWSIGRLLSDMRSLSQPTWASKLCQGQDSPSALPDSEVCKVLVRPTLREAFASTPGFTRAPLGLH